MPWVNPSTKLQNALPLKTHPAVFVPPAWPAEPAGVPILYIFPPSKQAITSVDAECVKYQAFLAFSNYKHTIQECHEPGMSPSGQLPFLIASDGRILTGRQIVEEVKNTAGDLESRLTDIERANLTSFTLLAETKLDFALLFTLWYDNRIRDAVTFPMYEALYPWPLNKILSRQIRAEKTEWMLSRKTVLKRDEILSDAKHALAALSTLLGNQLFFFGSKASFLDAVVFSYLHVILSQLALPGGEVPLREAVMRHDNLVQYCRRVFNTFFAST
ncbi:Metaxin-2 [Geranomyces variabilis]|nr:Metaxin-2 [Geranomyces variabilis]